jgi:hypothetical protein
MDEASRRRRGGGVLTARTSAPGSADWIGVDVEQSTKDTFARDLWMQFARAMVYSIVIIGVLILAIGLTILPALSDTAAQIVGGTCGVVGLGAGWAIEMRRSLLRSGSHK